jgi:hypothetical protein
MEVTMMRLWIAPLLLVLMSVSAKANTVTSIFLFPNDSTGDNFGFFQQSPGLMIGIAGGAPFSFFNSFGYAPGTSLGGTTDVFFNDGSITINGTSYDLDFQGTGSLFMSGITLPTNGAPTFTTTVSLSFGVGVVFFIDDTVERVDVGGKGTGTATFTLESDGNYYPQAIIATSTVPEPSALILLGTGMLSMLGVRKKLKA